MNPQTQPRTRVIQTDDPKPRPFLYLRDPLFLTCLALYALNRFLIEPAWPGGFTQSYLNDLIAIPFLVPFTLRLAKWLRLRRHDNPPTDCEIFLPLILWSVVFELWLPTTTLIQTNATADPTDISCYVLGTLIATAWWTYHYKARPRNTPTHQP